MLDFNQFDNNIFIVLVCKKCSKLITSEESIISIQQFLLCFPLLFVFSSEVLQIDIKSGLTQLFFQMQLCLCCIFASQGISQENFLMLYQCEDYKNIPTDKKFLQSRFFACFSGLCKLSRKFHFTRNNTFFQICLFAYFLLFFCLFVF